MDLRTRTNKTGRTKDPESLEGSEREERRVCVESQTTLDRTDVTKS